jgi:hypothetical protein
VQVISNYASVVKIINSLPPVCSCAFLCCDVLAVLPLSTSMGVSAVDVVVHVGDGAWVLQPVDGSAH